MFSKYSAMNVYLDFYQKKYIIWTKYNVSLNP